MEESSASPASKLKPKTVWTWLIISAAIPFLMLAAIIILMINLNFNFLNWME